MKYQLKRSIALVLVLVTLVSLLSGVTVFALNEPYKYNWGTRGTTATTLSSDAVAFYSGNGTSYATLSALSGSSTVSSVPSSDLYAALKSLMVSNHDYYNSYEDVKDLCKYTDCQNGGGKISSFYSGDLIGPNWDGSWNREHTWPNSKGLNGSDEDDIMMLRPSTVSENSSRGNTAYGRSSSYYDPNSESGGTYNLHGDVARIVLYVYTRWGNTSNMWGSSGVIESKEVLLDWMEEDPVDTWEMGRNDAVQSITGTRNVFVDFPELAFLLFGEDIPAGMSTPSGNAGNTYEITVTVNDSSMGSATVSGNNINAYPNEGYMVEGYTLVSGTATVSRSGNAFIVTASSDCTIQINFAPRTEVSLVYMDNGVTVSSETVYSGDAVTLPAYTGTAPQGCSFVGWSDTTVSHSDTVPTHYKSGESYTVTVDTTLHALFSYVAASEGGAGIWTLVTDTAQLAAGKQIIFAYTPHNVVSGTLDTSKKVLPTADAVFSSDLKTIVSMAEDAQSFTLGGQSGAWTFLNQSGQALGATSDKTSLSFTASDNTWSISLSGSDATIQNTASGRGKLQYNATALRFANYSSSTQKSPQIYVLDSSSTTYYTTSTCAHEDTTNVPAKAAACTADGYTAGVYCNDCSTYISGHETVPATGHSYESVVTPPTETEDGYTTHTCSVCGHSYVDSPVPALGETYIVSFSVPVGVPAIADMNCNNSGITLPVAEVPDSTYTFLGWTPLEIDNSTEEPAYYAGGTSYVANSDITLNALYSYAKDGTGERSYLLVENASQLIPGSKIVITSASKEQALSTTQNGNNRGQASVTKNSDKTLTLSSDVAELILGEGTKEGTWSFYCSTNSGYLYAASSSSNYLRTKNTLDDNGSFKIELGTGGAATVTAQGTSTHNLLRYNATSEIFSCYVNTQEAVTFYIETSDGTVYYTTEIVHVHHGVYREAVPATCSAAGNVAHYVCACGKNFADSACTEELTSVIIPKKDHDFTAKEAAAKYLCAEANCKSPASYYTSCANCGTSSKGTEPEDVFYSGDVNPDKHTGETYVSGKKDASCTADGYTGDTLCLGCDEKLESGEVIPGGHKLTAVAEVPATHKETGTAAHYKCSVCGKLFSDDKGSDEVAAAELVLTKIPHSFGDFKKDETKHWKECSCGEKSEEGEHTFGSWTTTQKATTELQGTKQRTCTVCGYVQTQSIPSTTTPSTGDISHIGLWLLLLAFSACGLFFLLAMFPVKKGKYLRR